MHTRLEAGAKIYLLVYNANGQIVYHEIHIDQDELRIDLQNLTPGVYHLAIIENNTKNMNAVKIIKL
ncbi:MAG: T9SS type A sorting domain-containing protein [Bacteroidales bacterium]|nr:T9SS type A sorting domain-containing protein [Bacteroidales bacterium]